MFYKDRPYSFAAMPEKYYYEYDEEKMRTINSMPFNFTLEVGKLDDFLDNDLSWPFMSIKMKNLFNAYSESAPPYNWVSALVDDSRGILKDYHFLVCLERPDVLELKKTKVIVDSYIYGFFTYEKIKNYAFFPHASEFKKGLIVSEKLKKEIEKSGITGVDFELADVVY